ncbi:MAG: hypothetical protein CSB55_07830 [Candidatus Cloacimonadota bacterium]|nr:MAG: hypothetical protein CSB55_07830 [Candidatus Cloacimonadota bacterium]
MSNKKELYPLKWKSFPLTDYPVQTVILLLFMIFLSWFLWNLAVTSWHMPLFYVFGIFIFVLELFPYFIPTKYEFSEDKIIVDYSVTKVRKNYSDFGCWYMDKKGIMLSTFKMPRRLDRFRGQSLRFSKDKKEKEKLIKILEERIGKQV